MKQIIYYKQLNGRCPYYDWLTKLDKVVQYRIEQRLERLCNGNYGDCKKLTNSELSEIRFMLNKGYRIYFKELDEIIILILAGSDKSNQKKVVQQANLYYKEFIERFNNNG